MIFIFWHTLFPLSPEVSHGIRLELDNSEASHSSAGDETFGCETALSRNLKNSLPTAFVLETHDRLNDYLLREILTVLTDRKECNKDNSSGIGQTDVLSVYSGAIISFWNLFNTRIPRPPFNPNFCQSFCGSQR